MLDLNFILSTNKQHQRLNFYVHVLRKTYLMNNESFIGLSYIKIEKNLIFEKYIFLTWVSKRITTGYLTVFSIHLVLVSCPHHFSLQNYDNSELHQDFTDTHYMILMLHFTLVKIHWWVLNIEGMKTKLLHEYYYNWYWIFGIAKNLWILCIQYIDWERI